MDMRQVLLLKYGVVTKMAWAKNGTPDTLTGVADHMDITDLSAVKFVIFLSHVIGSGQTEPLHRFNNDTANNYAYRYSSDGGADGTGVNSAFWFTYTAANNNDNFVVKYVINISAEEKLGILHAVGANTAGAANAPARREFAVKWDNTSAQITEIDVDNNGTGDFLTGSNLSALGTD